MPGRRTRILFLVLTAIAGVVVAHTADYLALLPDGGQRARYLAATGHGYWPQAVILATVAGVAVLALAARRGWQDALAGALPAPGDRPWTRSLPALCVGQVVLFTAMESLERVAAGMSAATLAGSREFLLGLALQLVVAAGAVALLVAVHRVAARVATALRRRPVAGPPRSFVTRLPARPAGAAPRRRLRARAPPLPA